MIKDCPTYKKSISKLASEIKIPKGKILVTGASGLIGSSIVDALLEVNSMQENQYEVYALSRNEELLKSRFNSTDKLHLVIQDIKDPITIHGLDYIIHAASNADPRRYALFPSETIITNIIGAKNVLDYSNKRNTRVVLLSSFEIYGKLEQDEYPEDKYGTIDLDLIRSCYPESKRTAEMLFKSYYDEYGVDCLIARLSSVYGPSMKEDDSKAHAQFIRKAMEGKDIVLKSEGKQKRTYSYVLDAISGIFTVLLKGVPGEAYNVANSKSVATIAEVAKAVADYVGTNVVYDLPDEDEKKGFSTPHNCILNTEKISKLGWKGQYDLKTGIAETIKILQEEKIMRKVF